MTAIAVALMLTNSMTQILPGGQLGRSPSQVATASPSPPGTFPGPRLGAALAYEGASRRLVLFSGVVGDGSAPLDDTWTGDEQAMSLHVGASPPGRSFPAITYDTIGRRVLMFGGGGSVGTSSDPPRNDTWTWTGSAGWTQLHPEVEPPAMFRPAMAADPIRGSVVLLGVPLRPNASPETWTWNGATWSQAHPIVTPSARSRAAMVFDDRQGKVLLVGGVQGTTEQLNDTWTWDGVNWTQIHPPASPRGGDGVAAYFEARALVVYLVAGETWTWDGSTWTKDASSQTPGPRLFVSGAYSAAAKHFVIIGGKLDGASQAGNEVWSWDGSGWTKRH